MQLHYYYFVTCRRFSNYVTIITDLCRKSSTHLKYELPYLYVRKSFRYNFLILAKCFGDEFLGLLVITKHGITLNLWV